jgi:hypothetical protein
MSKREQTRQKRFLPVVKIEEMPSARDAFCWECQNIWFCQASPGYSELTPGSDFSLLCSKNHWELDTYEDEEGTMGRFLKLAQRCPDFEART